MGSRRARPPASAWAGMAGEAGGASRRAERSSESVNGGQSGQGKARGFGQAGQGRGNLAKTARPGRERDGTEARTGQGLLTPVRRDRGRHLQNSPLCRKSSYFRCKMIAFNVLTCLLTLDCKITDVPSSIFTDFFFYIYSLNYDCLIIFSNVLHFFSQC